MRQLFQQKMKAFVVLALFVVSAFTIDIHSNVWSNREQQILAQIQNTNWGKWIINYAELSMSTDAAYLQQLLTAIEELIHDLNTELEDTHAKFNRRTDEHNREVVRLQQEIDQANRDLFNGNDLHDNVLVPTRQRLEKALDQLAANIKQNRRNLQDETLQRQKEHEAFEAKVNEHNEALAAVDECLGLLAHLQNPSLVQIKKVQQNLEKIHKSLKSHTTLTSLVKALVQMTTEQNFANQGAVAQILQAFNDLRVELVNSLNQETADEAAAQAEFDQRVIQLNAEHAEFQRQTLFRNAELTRTNEKIDETREYIQQRSDDLATLTGQLTAENDQYAQETDTYHALVAQYQREIDASNQALALLTQPSFTDYVKSKLGF